MDLFEKFNRSFGSWYEGLFGGSDDVRPKDILRRILAAMEDHRKEGFDNRVYVPNQFILEINVHDEEEKEYLLSFLDRDELEAAIRRYCQQNRYHIRGALDFTVKEVEDAELQNGRGRGEKVRVRCRYNTKIIGPEPAAAPVTRGANGLPEIPHEERTVASAGAEEGGTVPSVAAAMLVVYAPDRAPFRYALARQSVAIGRSQKAGNELVVETDGQISKRHARIELDPDGRFTIYDLGSTNGTKVNGRRVDNRTLNDGDEIILGETRLAFQQTGMEKETGVVGDAGQAERLAEPTATVGAASRSAGAFGGAAALSRRDSDEPGSSTPPARILRSRTARLALMQGDQEVDDYLLASETLIGRGVTNDIVLPDRSIATRHARITHDGEGYRLAHLAGNADATLLNGIAVIAGQEEALKDGDEIRLGSLTMRFLAGG